MTRATLLAAAFTAAALFGPVSTARAQNPVTRPDSLADTSAARRDSIARAQAEAARRRALADTIKAPIAHAEVPRPAAIGEPYAWTREGLFASGALTLGELIDRIPGVSTFRKGWIAAPELAAVVGRLGRVRIFLDGIELDPLSPRLGGQHDLSLLDFWNLDDATVETASDEIRIHLRTWTIRSTVPLTRIDIHTGDLQTNSYRGYYGRRLPGGQVVQAGGWHYSTLNRRSDEAGDRTSLWGRLGVARNGWTVDATLFRSGHKYTEAAPDGATVTDTVVDMDGLSTIAIARAAWGNAGHGPWFQALASTQSFSIRNPSSIVIDSVEGPGGGGPGGSPADPDTIEVSNDTTNTRPQFVLTGGLTRGPLRLSAAGRLRRWRGTTTFAPSFRAAYSSGALSLGLQADRSPLDSLQRLEGTASLTLAGRAALTTTVSQFSPIEGLDAPTSRAVRAEAGLRFGRLWLSAGTVFRDTAFLPAAIGFDTAYRTGVQSAASGFFATARGKFYRDVGVDVSATRYQNPGIYKPQYETRSRLYFDSDMRGKYPSGNLNVLMAVTHEYRTAALFPTADAVLESSQYRSWSAELEIRLLSATVTFLYRNFLGAEYQQVPGFTLPSITSYYGVRWTFSN